MLGAQNTRTTNIGPIYPNAPPRPLETAPDAPRSKKQTTNDIPQMLLPNVSPQLSVCLNMCSLCAKIGGHNPNEHATEDSGPQRKRQEVTVTVTVSVAAARTITVTVTS